MSDFCLDQGTRPKRVCFIRMAGVYPQGELNVRREVETLLHAGVETHIICLNTWRTERLPRDEITKGVHVHRIPVIRKKGSKIRYLYEYLMFFLLAAVKVTRLHLMHPFDAIQVNTMPDFLVFAAIIPKALKAKVVLMMHEPMPELWQTLYNSPAPAILKVVEQASLSFANEVLAVTGQLKESFVARGADSEKISVILNVPEERLLMSAEGSAQMYPDPNRFTLICHGAIEKRYGHKTILEAVALVRSKIPFLRLRVPGWGSYVKEFLLQIDKLGLKDMVNYLGYLPQSRLLEELKAADVGIVAQESSPYSNLVHTNKMYEYIALGKPVIASRLHSVRAYFGEEAICYFEPGNAQSLAEAILDLYLHPNKRNNLVKNSSNLYDLYKWENQKRIYLSVYRRILGIK